MQTSMQCTLTQQSNGDFSLLANITNPNRNIDLRFELFDVEFFFSDRIISTLHSALYSREKGGKVQPKTYLMEKHITKCTVTAGLAIEPRIKYFQKTHVKS
ncbi:hypothetical protein JHK82_048097 [Glycine max]|nr:hypothetical protein JHK82_048097 [Glycine max]